MSFLGPTGLSARYPLGTGLQVCRPGQPQVLGPVWARVTDHPLVGLFLVLGKLIHLRRLASSEGDHVEGGHDDVFREWIVSFGDQALSGDADEYAVHRLMVDQIDRLNAGRIETLQQFAASIDGHVQSVFRSDLVPSVVGITEEMGVPERVAAVISYMEGNDLSLEDTTNGFAAYFLQKLETPEGPAQFPVTDASPDVLDVWITDQVIDPGEIT